MLLTKRELKILVDHEDRVEAYIFRHCPDLMEDKLEALEIELENVELEEG